MASWRRCSVRVYWNSDRQNTDISLQCLSAAAIAGIATVVGRSFVRGADQMQGRFSVRAPSSNSLAELRSSPFLAEQGLWLPVIGQ